MSSAGQTGLSGQSEAESAVVAPGAVAVGLHTHQRRLMPRLLTGIADGMGHGLGQPWTETEQSGAGGEVHGQRHHDLPSLATSQGQANR